MDDAKMLFTIMRDFRAENQLCHVALDEKLTTLQADVAALQRWKAKVLGAALAISVLVSGAFQVSACL